LLQQYETGLHALASALLEKETLTSDEVEAIVSQHVPGDQPPPESMPDPTISPALHA
jgi:hypothetical protein